MGLVLDITLVHIGRVIEVPFFFCLATLLLIISLIVSQLSINESYRRCKGMNERNRERISYESLQLVVLILYISLKK